MANTERLHSELKACQVRVQEALEQRMPAETEAPQRFHQAMRYAVLNGGKRVRAALVYLTGKALRAPGAALDGPAMAVELVHAYSLVHDDLPCMDDDDLRRGVPTCHIAFDEATAMLAGDALQTLAFEVLTEGPTPAGTTVAMVATLARASGGPGMAGGQAIDLASVGQKLTLAQLQNMHELKTGALIRASVRLGALSAGADDSALKGLDRYAHRIGLAFQIQDDILDVEGDTETLGKQQGADQALDKPTYPAIVGLDEAKRMALSMHEEATEALQQFDGDADSLRWLSEFIITRSH
jgi:geranylgeranyl pyrophosphate synthase